MLFRFTIQIIAVFALTVLSIGNVLSASLVVDQTGSTFVSGGYTGGNVVQSFTPSQNNIAGVDAHYYAFAGTANISVNLWDVGSWTGNAFAGAPLHTESISGVSACGSGDIMCTEFRWGDAPTAITPGELYYLQFITTGGAIGASVQNPYPDGQTLFGGGNLFGGAADLAFRTYFAPVPVPAAVWLFCSALALLGVQNLRKP